jgi:hypothetical protein
MYPVALQYKEVVRIKVQMEGFIIMNNIFRFIISACVFCVLNNSAYSACTTTFTNPFNCKFAWGSTNSIYSPLTFMSYWVGYETNGGLSSWSSTATNSNCYVASTAKTIAGNSGQYLVLYAYFIGYQAKLQGGYGDCNTDNDDNLCTKGAYWIKKNWAQLVRAYGEYARVVYENSPSKPVIWWLEGDFIQYTYTDEQSSPLSFDSLGLLAYDIACAIKSNEPNAIVAINHSPWITDAQMKVFWAAMPDEIEMVWLQAPGDSEVLNNSYAKTGRWDSLAKYCNHRPIMAETSYGSLAGSRGNGWTTATATQINKRISEGAIAVHFNSGSSYSTSDITTLSSQLNSTKCTYDASTMTAYGNQGSPSWSYYYAYMDIPKIFKIGNTLKCWNVGNEVNIISVTGQKISDLPIPRSGFVDIASLPRGVYFARTPRTTIKFVR